jgi:hypothetical protein
MRNWLKSNRSKLSAPPPGTDDWWATVHVKFHEPIYDVDNPSETPAQGYYLVLGVRSHPHRVQQVISREVQDGVVEWEESEWHPVDLHKLDRTTRARITPVIDEGVWFRSGKVLYADPDLVPKPN